jgi:transposase InsO family protein
MGAQGSRGNVGDPAEALTTRARDPELLALRMVVREAATTETATGPTSRPLRDTILREQQRDAFVAQHRDGGEGKKEGYKIGDVAPVGGNRSGDWRMYNGMLYHGNAVYVPACAALRQEILRVHHDDPWAGHFGRDKTFNLVNRKFYWPRIRTDVEEYVESCLICQKMKVPRQLPQGKLAPLPVPEGAWQDLTMDFIVGLPPSTRQGSVYDAILVIVDRYTKAARYLPTTSKVNAEDLTNLFLQEIVFKTGAPRSIVTDQGSLFTSAYWAQFCQGLRVKGRLSTMFHPQTDGQTERQNQTLETYLRTFTNFQQSDWADWLVTAEFAYNNAKNASTGYSPLMAWQGLDPELPGAEGLLKSITNNAVEIRLKGIAQIRTQLEENLRMAIARQAASYDKRHREEHFSVGEEVLLLTKNI